MSWLGPDKAKHFAGGLAIGAFSHVCTSNLLLSLIAGVAVGAAKEIWDFGMKGDFSPEDMAWTSAGGFLGTGLSWLAMRLLG